MASPNARGSYYHRGIFDDGDEDHRAATVRAGGHEAGTGKELIEPAIHYNGPRKERLFEGFSFAEHHHTLDDAQCLPLELREGVEERRDRTNNLKGISRESVAIVGEKAVSGS